MTFQSPESEVLRPKLTVHGLWSLVHSPRSGAVVARMRL
jgi:hypothetical protein